MRTRTPHRVAFVLSGGASLGAIQVGMLRALFERDVRPDLIVGTSVGAVNGAFVASHGPTLQTVDELAELWRGMRRGRVFPLEPLTGLLGFLGARRNLVPGTALRHLITRNALQDRLEELPVPLHIVACDVLSGAEVLLSRGPLADAVLAGAAIPGVLPAVEWEGRLLIDGGVVDNTPLSHAIALGASEIYVLPTGGPCELTAAPRGALAMVLHATGLMVAQRFAAEVTSFAGRADIVVLPPPCPIHVHPMDFGHADALIRRALTDARAFLDGRPPTVVLPPSAPWPGRPAAVAAAGRSRRGQRGAISYTVPFVSDAT